MSAREREREREGKTKRKHNFVNKLYTKWGLGLGLRNGALGDSLGPANMLLGQRRTEKPQANSLK